jgi:hypothetical protein
MHQPLQARLYIYNAHTHIYIGQRMVEAAQHMVQGRPNRHRDASGTPARSRVQMLVSGHLGLQPAGTSKTLSSMGAVL